MPRYVVDIDPDNARVIVGYEEDLIREEFETANVSWPDGEPEGAFEASVKIRYAHPGTAATITPLGDGQAHIRLHEPQRAVTPGQAAVFYDGDRVAGGGWISRKPAMVVAA